MGFGAEMAMVNVKTLDEKTKQECDGFELVALVQRPNATNSRQSGKAASISRGFKTAQLSNKRV